MNLKRRTQKERLAYHEGFKAGMNWVLLLGDKPIAIQVMFNVLEADIKADKEEIEEKKC